MTAQAGDRINIEGKEYSLFSNPLESYWDEEKPKPKFLGIGTHCWRRYIASWEIDNGYLYLTGIRATYENDEEVTLQSLFPDNNEPRVKAAWVTEDLRIPDGERLGPISLYVIARSDDSKSILSIEWCFRLSDR